jgi:hypothetical protein
MVVAIVVPAISVLGLCGYAVSGERNSGIRRLQISAADVTDIAKV